VLAIEIVLLIAMVKYLLTLSSFTIMNLHDELNSGIIVLLTMYFPQIIQ